MMSFFLYSESYFEQWSSNMTPSTPPQNVTNKPLSTIFFTFASTRNKGFICSNEMLWEWSNLSEVSKSFAFRIPVLPDFSSMVMNTLYPLTKVDFESLSFTKAVAWSDVWRSIMYPFGSIYNTFPWITWFGMRDFEDRKQLKIFKFSVNWIFLLSLLSSFSYWPTITPKTTLPI